MAVQHPLQILGLHEDNIPTRQRGPVGIGMLGNDIASGVVDIKDNIRKEGETVVADMARGLRPEPTRDDLLENASPLGLDPIDMGLSELPIVHILKRLQELVEMLGRIEVASAQYADRLWISGCAFQ